MNRRAFFGLLAGAILGSRCAPGIYVRYIRWGDGTTTLEVGDRFTISCIYRALPLQREYNRLNSQRMECTVYG